jgi:hypothetical protein
LDRHSNAINLLIPAIAIAFSFLQFAGCSRQQDRIRRQYAAISKNLLPFCDGFLIKDTPQAGMLLDQKWSLESDWVIEFLNTHPSATVEQISTAISDLDKGLSGSVDLLDKNLYGISIQENGRGNVFLASSDGKHFRAVWNAKDAMPAAGKKGNFLHPWSAEAARDGCRNNSRESEEDGPSCGPLCGGFGRLPNDKMGRLRFYLVGVYAQYAGLNATAQLSIWTWDGHAIRPQFTGTYTYYVDKPGGMRLDGDVLRIRVRDQYRTFSTCCDDEGRPMDWNLKLTPTGVEDIGKTPVVSKLETIDELFYRIARAMPIKDIASPQVLSRARTLIRQFPQTGGLPVLGTLEFADSKPVGGVTELCFLEGYGLSFVITQIEGKPYLLSLKQLDRCPSEPANK